MTYRIGQTYPDSLCFFPRDVLKKMTDAGERELKILLFVLAALKDGLKDEESLVELVRTEGFEPMEIRSALAFWRGGGVLKALRKGEKAPVASETVSAKKEKKPVPEEAPAPAERRVDADEPPFYTSHDLGKAAEKNPRFSQLVDFAQKKLEKVLNASELAKLWSFLDYLQMPVEVVMLVIEDCCNRGKKSLRYITKMLNTFHDDEITDYQKAEAFFLRRDARYTMEGKVRTLFGIGDRKLSSVEEANIAVWSEKWHVSDELLDAAYDRTAMAAKKPSVSYMHRVLENWHEAGITTPEELLTKENKDGKKAEKSYDLDEFFDAAVEKGMN